jgi:death-on-curing family protein
MTIRDVEFIAHRMAIETMSWSEPIPSFGTRYPEVLERCIGQLYQTFGGKQLYPGLIKKVTILFYLMIKNHPFQNGNKRLAMATLLCFLFKNKKWIKVDDQELYNFAKWVAESNSKLKKPTMEAVEIFLNTYITDL